MGWERKRGKLEELNRLLRGDRDTSYARHVGDPTGLVGIRFVITLDSDTQLPMGSAHRLVGLLAHPLNRAVVRRRRPGASSPGYTIVQPRIETSPSSSRQTRFSRIFAGDVGFDIYTHAVLRPVSGPVRLRASTSARASTTSTRSCAASSGGVPRTRSSVTICSRASTAARRSPPTSSSSRTTRRNYATYAQAHAPVGARRLAAASVAASERALGGAASRLRNKLVEHRSLEDRRQPSPQPDEPAACSCSSCSAGPGCPASPLVWTLVALAVLLAPLVPRARAQPPAGASRTSRAARSRSRSSRTRRRSSSTRSCACSCGWRSRDKHLLQWTSAAHTAFGAEGASRCAAVSGETMCAVAAARGRRSRALVAWVRPSALVVAAPLLVLWLLAPEIARWVSQPVALARRAARAPTTGGSCGCSRAGRGSSSTRSSGPTISGCPIDNYQEEPHEQTAHRTSPTNIGLMLLSTLSAYDFGYLGPSELSLAPAPDVRQHRAPRALPGASAQLVRDEEPPAAAPALRVHGRQRELRGVPARAGAGLPGGGERARRARRRRGTVSATRSTSGGGGRARPPDVGATSLRRSSRRMRAAVAARARPPARRLRDAPDAVRRDLRRARSRAARVPRDRGAPARGATCSTRCAPRSTSLHQQLQQMRRELDTLLPWLALTTSPRRARSSCPPTLGSTRFRRSRERLRAELEAWERERRERGRADLRARGLRAPARRGPAAAPRPTADRARAASCSRSRRAAERGGARDGLPAALRPRAEALSHRLQRHARSASIAHYYDLLASEARLASYLAIVKRDVPESHWYALGRPMTRVAGAPALLSWGGTMFEYLMPNLLMRSQEGTLLARTERARGRRADRLRRGAGEPWGVSESAYARVDAHQTYQYRVVRRARPRLQARARRRSRRRAVRVAARRVDPTARRRRQPVASSRRWGCSGPTACSRRSISHARARARRPLVRGRALVHGAPPGHAPRRARQLLNARTHGRALSRGPGDRDRRDAAQRARARRRARRVAASTAVESVEPIAIVADRRRRAGARGHRPARIHPAGVRAEQRPPARASSPTPAAAACAGTASRSRATSPTRPATTTGCGSTCATRTAAGSGSRPRREGRTTFAMHKAEFHRRDEGISVHVDVTVAPGRRRRGPQITLHNETDRAAAAHRDERRASPCSSPRGRRRRTRRSRACSSRASGSPSSTRSLFARRPQSAEGGARRARAPARARRRRRDRSQATRPIARRSSVARASASAPASLVANHGAAARSRRRGARSRDEPDGARRAEAEADGDARLRDHGRRARAARRSRSPASTARCTRCAGRSATPSRRAARRLQRTRLDPALLPAVQRLFSALLFADPTLRATPDGDSPGRARASARLWGRGISGDDPIVLVRVHDPEAPLLGEVLAAQRYLRACGVRLDLVLVDEQATGYATEGLGHAAQRARDATTATTGSTATAASSSLAGRSASGATSAVILEASARVVLDTRDGVARGAARVAPSRRPPKLPRFEPTLAEEVLPTAPRRRDPSCCSTTAPADSPRTAAST